MPASSSSQSPEPRARPLSESDSRALARFLDQSLGHGFRLAIVEAASPADREAILADLAERVGPGLMRVDVDALPGADANLWQALQERFAGEDAPRCLALWGIESRAQPDWPRQLNVQRDLFVRDIAVPWLLFIHPATRVPLLQEAPDFCDFAILWLRDERPVRQVSILAGAVPMRGSLPVSSGTLLRSLSIPSPMLKQAMAALDVAHFDEARDHLSRFDLQPEPAFGDRIFRQLLGARVEREQGQFARAEAILRDTRNTLARLDPGFEQQMLMQQADTELGLVMYSSGRLDEAEALLRQSLAHEAGSPGHANPNYAVALHTLALMRSSQGRLAESEALLRECLAHAEKTLPREHRVSLASTMALATVLHGQDKTAEAEALLRASMARAEEAQGRDRPLYNAAQHALASMFVDQGRYAEAEALLRESLARARKIQGAEHPDYGSLLHTLALVHQFKGELDEAAALLRESLTIKEKALGAAHPWCAEALTALARVLMSQGKYAEAEALFRKSLELTEKTLGAAHPALTGRLAFLALLLTQQEKHEQATALLQRAFGILETAQGDVRMEYALVLWIQAEIQTQMQDPQAQQTLRRAKAVLVEKLGFDPPSTSVSAAVDGRKKSPARPKRERAGS